MKQRLITLFAVGFLLVSCGEGAKPDITLAIKDVDVTKLALYQNVQLTATTNESNPNIIWSSSDPTILDVSETGLVTALGEGFATISATLASNTTIKDSLDFTTYCLVDDIDNLKNEAPVYEKLGNYTPVKFKESTWKVEETEALADGLDLVHVSLELTSGRVIKPKILEIDLNQSVEVVAGSYNNSLTLNGKKQNLYSQITAYEDANPDMKVVGATNADFFGNFPVNAFVKDNHILRDAHLDNGGYDYTNTNNDIPASMPMLFGVNNKFAQVGAIVDGLSVERTIKSKLTYELHAVDNEGQVIMTFDNIQRNVFTQPDFSRVNLITSSSRNASAPANATVYTVKRHNEGYLEHGEVINIEKVNSVTQIVPANNYIFVIVPEALTQNDIQVGNFFAYNIASEDGKWNGYKQILGARQELVRNGEIVSTVTKENTNGAQTTNVPRTAVGIKEDGKVVLFAIESLYYGKKSTDPNDPYGVNLPELAEIMRYYGCVNAGNFDGGGSTQMIIDREGNDEVVVRSSDYGTSNLSDGRAIINSFLIVTKK